MLKTPKNYTYDKLLDSLSRQDYKIAANDVIEYNVFTNNGFKLIEMTSSGANNVIRNNITITVESNGTIKMPLVGLVAVKGLTLKEAEKLLEEKYAKFYVEPFVNLRVTNKRVIVFPGGGGTAKIIPLQNNNTTVMEAIAGAGGIVDDGKAYKVKLIRNAQDSTNRSLVYKMDLSKIEGIVAGQSIVQAGDIIYVEPRFKPVLEFTRELLPILTFLTTTMLLVRYYRMI